MPLESSGLPTDLLDHGQKRTLRWLRAGIAFSILVPALFFVLVAYSRYEQVWNEQRSNIERVTHIVAEHALKLFDTNQVLLHRLIDLVDDKTDAEILADEAALHEKAKRMVAGLPQIQSVWVMDAAGHPLLTNRFLPAPRALDLSDRESFQSHRAGNNDLFITGALLGKKTNEIFFDLTRRRQTPDGSFAGTVQVSLYPKYLVDFYQTMAPRNVPMVIAITKSDGTFIARWPQLAEVGSRISIKSGLVQAMLQDSASGTISLTSTIDRIDRQVSYRKIGAYPVYVSVGVADRDITEIWLSEMKRLLYFALPVIAVIAVLGVSLLRRTKQQFQVANTLYGEVLHRKEIEQSLLQSQKMEALGYLTSGVAHDFNNLLMTIDMSAHVLAETIPEYKNNPRLGAIRRAIDSGAKLTRQLLSFSQRQPLSLTTLSLQVTLPAIMELCKPVLGRNIEIRVDVDPFTPAVKLDRAELELAMLNLAINAKHAMPDGGSLEVIAHAVKATDASFVPGKVRIQVRDTGTGIAPEIMDRVFEAFFTTRKKGQGTGLGLSQVKSMCERAGGSIHLESEVGKGTTVHMVFEASVDALDDVLAQTTVTRAMPSTVLLVEDNEEIATATQLALASLGCEVKYCASAQEAVNFLQKHAGSIDLVLSDIMMPGAMDGIGLAKHIGEQYPSLPIVLMTGYAERITDAEEMGLQILAKPFGVPALRDLLNQVTMANAT